MGLRTAIPGTVAAVIATAVILTPLTRAGASPAPDPRPAGAQPAAGSLPSWQLRPTGLTQRFRGLAPVSAQVAWVSSSSGTVLRTTDGGQSWQNVSPPDAAGLQFRDLAASDAQHAVAMASGTGDASRVYRTADGGQTWQLAVRNADPDLFFDCMAFADPLHGLVLADPVGGSFRLLATADGGQTWVGQSTKGLPPALDGEFAFAASGTCLVAQPGGQFWFGTGGGAQSRVFRSADGGRTWQVSVTPVASGPSSGIFSLAFRDSLHGIAVGGDFTTPAVADRVAATTADGGSTWTLVPAEEEPAGYRSGSTFVTPKEAALAVGPTGSDISLDGGRSWQAFDSGSFDSVQCAPLGGCWASGEQGRVAVLGVAG